jgi:hypothetical protein
MTSSDAAVHVGRATKIRAKDMTRVARRQARRTDKRRIQCRGRVSPGYEVTRKGLWLFVPICLKYQALRALVPNKARTNQITTLVFC